MKGYLCAAVAAALLMPGAWATPARAEDDAPPPEEMGHPGMHPGMPPGGPKMGERMRKKLELTDEQAAKFKEAVKAHEEAMKPLGRQMKETMKKLAEQVKSKASDADLQASLDALKSAHKAMAAEQEKFHDALAVFLTPTQRAKMAVGWAMRMRRERDERGGPGPRERGPRAGGPKGDDERGGPRDKDDDGD